MEFLDSEGSKEIYYRGYYNIKSPEEIQKLIEQGDQKISNWFHRSNYETSRFYKVLNLNLERIENRGDKIEVISSHLAFVDGADGSKMLQTMASIDRLMEGKDISKTYTAL
mmetsp:Transcript_20701/g.18351  ORF Transcript_20701/g.18351 Transcript_20701/m.18351 type:complete len:111 (+) Transcript_20701:428-760(+)